MTRSSTKELLSPFENSKQKIRSRRRLFDTLSLVDSNSQEFDHNFDILEQSEEEVRETMTDSMEQYMSKTRENYGSGVTRPTINQDTPLELKGQFLKELHDNTFSGSEHKDANEHIKKVLEIVDLFHIPKVTQDQIMLQAFPVSLTGAASRWLRNQPSGSITTWEVLKTKFLNKYCPPARTAKKMEEINNFQQEPDESLFRAWERFKELLMKCPQHYLTDMQEVILFYNGLDKWHNGTSSRTRSTETSDGLVAIQSQLNNLEREIKKVNEKVYAAQVGCELCKGPHYTKDCPQKEEGKTLEEAYYTQFGAPYQPGGQYRAAGLGFYQRNNGYSSYHDRRPSLEESLTKFMAESAKRHEENSNIIKEIRASTDAAIRNQGASIKTLEIQIGQMSKVLQERRLIPFPNRLQNFNCDDWREAQDVKILDAYDHTLPPKEKDPWSFTLPCFIHNICFDKALVDLEASFTIVDDDDMAKDVVLGMKFCKNEYECSSLALDRRRNKVEDEIGSLETRLSYAVIKRFKKRKKEKPTSPCGRSRRSQIYLGAVLPIRGPPLGFDSNEEEVVPKVDDVYLVDGVFDGVFGGDGDEDFVIGEGVVVSSSSLVKSINSFLGGMMVSLIFLEGLEEEAWVEAMEVEEK
ncbi:hypothetical protein Tco_1228411 [Tanacetum coccineum]